MTKKCERNRSKFLPIFIFAVYLFGIFFVTGTGTLFHILQFGIEITAGQINILSFSDNQIDLLAYLLNIVLFMPLGFLIPVIWPNLNKFRYIVVCGVSLSLLIDISHLLNQRRTDIDDLFLNTAGAIIGYLLFKLIANISKRFNNTSTDTNYEVVIYILVMFIGLFFLLMNLE